MVRIGRVRKFKAFLKAPTLIGGFLNFKDFLYSIPGIIGRFRIIFLKNVKGPPFLIYSTLEVVRSPQI